MANAARDDNFVPGLLAVSSTDGTTLVRVFANPATHRLLTESPVSSGSGAPSSTPTALGQTYIDTMGAKVYVSTGTSSSADWALLN